MRLLFWKPPAGSAVGCPRRIGPFPLLCAQERKVCSVSRPLLGMGAADSELTRRRREVLVRQWPHAANLQIEKAEMETEKETGDGGETKERAVSKGKRGRRGRRGGWWADPQMEIPQLGGENPLHDQIVAEQLSNVDDLVVADMIRRKRQKERASARERDGETFEQASSLKETAAVGPLAGQSLYSVLEDAAETETLIKKYIPSSESVMKAARGRVEDHLHNKLHTETPDPKIPSLPEPPSYVLEAELHRHKRAQKKGAMWKDGGGGAVAQQKEDWGGFGETAAEIEGLESLLRDCSLRLDPQTQQLVRVLSPSPSASTAGGSVRRATGREGLNRESSRMFEREEFDFKVAKGQMRMERACARSQRQMLAQRERESPSIDASIDASVDGEASDRLIQEDVRASRLTSAMKGGRQSASRASLAKLRAASMLELRLEQRARSLEADSEQEGNGNSGGHMGRRRADQQDTQHFLARRIAGEGDEDFTYFSRRAERDRDRGREDEEGRRSQGAASVVGEGEFVRQDSDTESEEEEEEESESESESEDEEEEDGVGHLSTDPSVRPWEVVGPPLFATSSAEGGEAASSSYFYPKAVSQRRERKARRAAAREQRSEQRVSEESIEEDPSSVQRTGGGRISKGREIDIFSALSETRPSALGSLWAQRGARFVDLNGCVVPSTFDGTSVLESHRATRTAAAVTDESFRFALRLEGRDSLLVGDHFLTCPLKKMEVGDVQYACVLDSKGLILDDAFVKKGRERVEILVSGHNRRAIFEYLADYVSFCRQTGLEVLLRPSPLTSCFSLQGPQASRVLVDVLGQAGGKEGDHDDDEESRCEVGSLFFDSEGTPVGAAELAGLLDSLPYMHSVGLKFRWVPGGGKGEARGAVLDLSGFPAAALSVDGEEKEKLQIPLRVPPLTQSEEVEVWRVGVTGEDGFVFLSGGGALGSQIDEGRAQGPAALASRLLAHPLVKPSGVYCLDILRMEAGLCRAGVDVTERTTPVAASLLWLLDQEKMRRHELFGWKRLFVHMSRRGSYKRVGLLAGGHVFAGCKIVSSPYRRAVGQVTSTAWSPCLQRRVAMGYVIPEFAKHGAHVLFRVPLPLPNVDHLTRRVRRRLLRSRRKRELVAGRVVRLPFVLHDTGPKEGGRLSLPSEGDFSTASFPLPPDSQLSSKEQKRLSQTEVHRGPTAVDGTPLSAFAVDVERGMAGEKTQDPASSLAGEVSRGSLDAYLHRRLVAPSRVPVTALLSSSTAYVPVRRDTTILPEADHLSRDQQPRLRTPDPAAVGKSGKPPTSAGKRVRQGKPRTVSGVLTISPYQKKRSQPTDRQREDGEGHRDDRRG
uniref:Aminomethyltransferase folate-binding domain-containing protein n=1 Tax=Chromera velia CCMP2878 TaxID=1169474 RepID=A0A0G4HHQ5_9ALVE|eukprot:Cvel_6911.t1-p1 / transcript=Cvel_6911.t1 / gene=Cvel_6911 / organism=Chromera_velia_CCMP2878 / gene_product=Aminomethyltransferase, mitochondrial, putative / transcript_product=Aminomethyltransferase, mitochondrial, putative / location=Cvel_scaffold349:73813-79837(+) / protein_length=1330 / sequence_SO=supercontig / SO=protein_coding / is_pseudo=false